MNKFALDIHNSFHYIFYILKTTPINLLCTTI